MSNRDRAHRLMSAPTLAPVDDAPLTEAFDIIEHGTEFNLARNRLASMPREWLATQAKEWGKDHVG